MEGLQPHQRLVRDILALEHFCKFENGSRCPITAFPPKLILFPAEYVVPFGVGAFLGEDESAALEEKRRVVARDVQRLADPGARAEDDRVGGWGVERRLHGLRGRVLLRA